MQNVAMMVAKGSQVYNCILLIFSDIYAKID